MALLPRVGNTSLSDYCMAANNARAAASSEDGMEEVSLFSDQPLEQGDIPGLPENADLYTPDLLRRVFNSDSSAVDQHFLGNLFSDVVTSRDGIKLDIVLASSRFRDLSATHVDFGLIVAASIIRPDLPSMEKILLSERSQEISAIALSRAFDACVHKHVLPQSVTNLKRILSLPYAEDIAADKLLMVFDELQNSKYRLEGTYENLQQMACEILRSQHAQRISSKDLSQCFIKALDMGQNEIADAIKTYARDKISIEPSSDLVKNMVRNSNVHGIALIFACCNLSAEVLVDAVSTIVWAVESKYGESHAAQILKMLLNSLAGFNLSDRSRAILIKEFWGALVEEREDLLTVYLGSFVKNLIGPSDLNQLNVVCLQRYREACEALDDLRKSKSPGLSGSQKLLFSPILPVSSAIQPPPQFNARTDSKSFVVKSPEQKFDDKLRLMMQAKPHEVEPWLANLEIIDLDLAVATVSIFSDEPRTKFLSILLRSKNARIISLKTLLSASIATVREFLNPVSLRNLKLALRLAVAKEISLEQLTVVLNWIIDEKCDEGEAGQKTLIEMLEIVLGLMIKTKSRIDLNLLQDSYIEARKTVKKKTGAGLELYKNLSMYDLEFLNKQVNFFFKPYIQKALWLGKLRMAKSIEDMMPISISLLMEQMETS